MKTVKHLSEFEVMQLLGGVSYKRTHGTFECAYKDGSIVIIRVGPYFALEFSIEKEEQEPFIEGKSVNMLSRETDLSASNWVKP